MVPNIPLNSRPVIMIETGTIMIRRTMIMIVPVINVPLFIILSLDDYVWSILAHASISTTAPNGSADTATAERAGR